MSELQLPPDNPSISAAEATDHEARGAQTFALTSASGCGAGRGTLTGASMPRTLLEHASRQLELLALRSLELADRKFRNQINARSITTPIHRKIRAAQRAAELVKSQVDMMKPRRRSSSNIATKSGELRGLEDTAPRR
jgi:hypothetical protein